MSIANIILQQIGKMALYMMGGCNYISTGKGVEFRVKGSKIGNHIRIILKGDDTYTIEVRKIWGTQVKLIDTKSGIYCDMLASTIGNMVGLYTHL